MAPSNIPWLTNPDLFLLREGGIVQVWKCKRTISEALLMKRNDFEYVDDVENYLDLIQSMFNWPEDGYKALVKYISERRLLVNGQGLVIAELPKFSPDDGKMDESLSPLFMRSLDILALDTYMQHYMVRPIPFRPIQYLEDKNGPARDVQEVELSPNELKLTAELEKDNNDKKALDKEVDDLNIKKKGIDYQVAKLEKDLAGKTKDADAEQKELDRVKSQLEGRVADVEGKNRGLEGRIAQLTAELAELRRQIASLQQQLIGANNDKDALDRKIIDLQNQHDNLINNNKNKNKNRPEREHWMNDYYESDWVGYYALERLWKVVATYGHENKVDMYLINQYSNFAEDNTTNVRREWFCELRTPSYELIGGEFSSLKAVDVARVSPNGLAKARFDPKIWGLLVNKGICNPCRHR